MADRIPATLLTGLSLPLIAAPMFLVSGVELVAEACRCGVIGAFPSINARSPAIFEQWLADLRARLEGHRALAASVAPFAVNIAVHSSNPRLEADLSLCMRYEVPLVITSLGGPKRAVDAVHGYGGIVFADVNTPELARKAVRAGVDGLVLVSAGAGGHTGQMSPVAFVAAVREFWHGTIVLAGALASGADLRAAQMLGADLGYMGTRFIATTESLAVAAYKEMLVSSSYEDIVMTNALTGAWANKLRPSLVAAGLDPDRLRPRERFDLANADEDIKSWRDLWSAGHGVGGVKGVCSVRELVLRIADEYDDALARELSDPWRSVRDAARRRI